MTTTAKPRPTLRFRQAQSVTRRRNLELLLLAGGSLLVAGVLALTWKAKWETVEHHREDLREGRVAQINPISPDHLRGVLRTEFDADEMEFVLSRMQAESHGIGGFANVGDLASMRLSGQDLTNAPPSYKEDYRNALQRRKDADHARARDSSRLPEWFRRWTAEESRPVTIPLFQRPVYARLKPLLVVREPEAFRSRMLWRLGLFFGLFYLVHLFWRRRRFAGDPYFLPVVHVLTGLGLALMLSLRDPLRDTLLAAKFAEGVCLGCVVLAVLSAPDYERLAGRLSFVFLLAAIGLAVMLGAFGSGPGTSDARINLLGFQPVELIRILIVFFLAGYFSRHWDAIRQLDEKRGIWNWFGIARLDYVLPVAIGIAAPLMLFVWLRDMGPALVIGGVFLTLYCLARRTIRTAVVGVAILLGTFALAYSAGWPATVSERVSIWRSVWANDVPGGDQIAHALWALSAGGLAGMGPGLGEAQSVPLAHTDLILAALAEDLGFAGLAIVFLLFALLAWRSLRAALNAGSTYSFFLGVGLSLILFYQLVLITAGILGVFPLTGVVTPFLSDGRTSMIANFAVIAILLSISARSGGDEQQIRFGGAVRGLGIGLGFAGVLLLARAGYTQTVAADETLVRPALVIQADGGRRYQYNPRIRTASAMIPKGTIFDRNGLPLATGDWRLIEKSRAQMASLAVPLDANMRRADSRHYPFGPPLFYLLGDVRSRVKQGARATAFEEKASRVRLQGFDDYREPEEGGDGSIRLRYDYSALIPLIRHRHDPDNPKVRRLLETPRDVHMSIDARLQWRLSNALAAVLAQTKSRKGAIVVLDPSTGDVLALVSYPWPTSAQLTSGTASDDLDIPETDLIDRARFGLYPPGSSFKVVTAIAALKKDPALADRKYECIRLPDGRVGNRVKGFGKPIRDDIKDSSPHGTVDLARGVAVSCNAYFAQLGAYDVGAESLRATAAQFGIRTAAPDTARQLARSLPQAAYGQGQVVASPFQMARVAAAAANGGQVLQGRWITDETNPRRREAVTVLPPERAAMLALYMRSVVTSGTGRRRLGGSKIPIAGKTGTAELERKPSHAWFVGFAPYPSVAGRTLAFSVLIENGGYGGDLGAQVAQQVVDTAAELGYFQP